MTDINNTNTTNNVNDNKDAPLSFEEKVTFFQSKGFFYGPEPQIYGGTSGFFTYGPIGKLLKNNVENAIRRVFKKYSYWEVECPIVMPEIVWKASGHLGGFSDPVITCSKCKSNFRVDKLLEEKFPDKHFKKDEFLKVIKDNGMKCTSCNSDFVMEIRQHDLMMKTTIGFDGVAYNRPETATTTYLPFNNYVNFFRDKLPFGIFQIGKAFRNEISPRQSLIRTREFTQAEGQFFIFGDKKNSFNEFDRVKDFILPLLSSKDQESNVVESKNVSLNDAVNQGLLKNKAYAYTLAITYELFCAVGIKRENIRFRQHCSDEMAFYADDAWDLEVKLSDLGFEEFCGVHDRTNYDLTQHEKFSKKKLQAENDGEREIPHILEIAFGVDRIVYALLDQAFVHDKSRDNKVLHFSKDIAPIQVGVFPLVNKLNDKALEVDSLLKDQFICLFDKSGSIGRRYARADEQGIPFCVTIDYDTLEKDDSVTVRNIDDTSQTRVKISDLVDYIKSNLSM